ncbi:cystathionine beta-lyase family protein involved in aluminum resistance [Hydrogenoanaerobacterium saccharovorans]|uniref:Cystathionine beta-lyase family protein involved in aluminum resistance n=1 Tax=Hydrogenoanaerobacterium saccharovorans TaxID=474960 RepID=A0A1H8BMY1_9FIRM|nr:methionine gamma-lyase family protein [Hydrogenoanaerobacterium saccharovorans]RPF47325.1 cystathionine beta-lyase family protein involved in aluminum resistance [Hydrogenoanaerobacterium saccharovorans]SEM84153.1 Cystathionine beta-lyase family protein involved in aluminum resistance [Hydrogenoanaerobacterium saccharovorans]
MEQNFFQIDPYLQKIAKQAEEKCAARFAQIDEIAEYNQLKVLSAFNRQGLSETHFVGSTGYGYGDRGREVLDAVFAEVMGCEDALVRHNFVSGTHALTTALFGVLRPGDVMVSITGSPYDTMEEVIGIRGENTGSLKDFGVHYRQLNLLPDGTPDYEQIAEAVKGAKVAYVQRSRGYALRPSLRISEIEKLCKAVRAGNPDAIIMVDNCYGEFVEEREPTQAGADLIIGSLIKNAGGGIAQTGGYIAGRKDLVELCAYRLTSPGMGKEVGCTLGQTRNMFMGLFFAPDVVENAVKTAVFASAYFELLGFEVYPKFDEPRTDIIQAVTLGSEAGLVAFCQGVQKGSPVDAFVQPEPWAMPGYDSPVIMAAGAFTMGASIELSADGPIREPYAVWLQGGLTYHSGKMGILLAAQSMLERGAIAK